MWTPLLSQLRWPRTDAPSTALCLGCRRSNQTGSRGGRKSGVHRAASLPPPRARLLPLLPIRGARERTGGPPPSPRSPPSLTPWTADAAAPHVWTAGRRVAWERGGSGTLLGPTPYSPPAWPTLPFSPPRPLYRPEGRAFHRRDMGLLAGRRVPSRRRIHREEESGRGARRGGMH